MQRAFPRPPAAVWWVSALSLGVLAVVALRAPFPTQAGLGAGLLALAGAAWLCGVWFARAAPPRWRELLLFAVVLRVVAFVGAPALSDDLPRYVWEASVLRAGISPYAHAPADPALAQLREQMPEVYASLNNRDVRAAYPPLYQAANFAVVGLVRLFVAPDSNAFLESARRALRLFAALCDLLLLWPLSRLARSAERARGGRSADPNSANPTPRFAAWIWGSSPLAAMECAGVGHLDVFGVLLWLVALMLLIESRPVAWWTLAGAVLVKYLPLVSVPFALREARSSAPRRALLLALLGAGSFVPFLFLQGGRSDLLGGLRDYGLRWESTPLLYDFLERPFERFFAADGSWSDPRKLGRLLALALVTLSAAALWWRRASLLFASAALIGTWLVLSPTLHPWYALWTLPFAALFGAASFLYLAAALPLHYVVLEGWHARGEWLAPEWLWPAVALPFFALLVLDLRRLRNP